MGRPLSGRAAATGGLAGAGVPWAWRSDDGSQSASRPRILLIGPLPGPAEVIGGTKVHFAETLRHLEGAGLDVASISTTRPHANLPRPRQWVNQAVVFFRVVRGLLRSFRHVRLAFLNTSGDSALIGASSIWFLCKALGLPLALQFFGNGYAFLQYGPAARWWAKRTFLSSSRVYVQTRQLHRLLGGAPNVRWFPNTRDLRVSAPRERRRVERLLFVSQLRMEKGLAEALEACRRLPEECLLRVYGPRMPDTDMSLFEGHPRASYRGVLDPEDVPRVLQEHDLLLFPSYWRNEGHPGVVLEAFQCGLPVVATRWGGIPEVVEHEKNGLLVEPRSADSIEAAVDRVRRDPDLYRRLCAGARERGELFRSGPWHRRMAEDLRGLAGG